MPTNPIRPTDADLKAQTSKILAALDDDAPAAVHAFALGAALEVVIATRYPPDQQPRQVLARALRIVVHALVPDGDFGDELVPPQPGTQAH